ncbi:MFS transporter [Streptomyces sp. CB01580]|uniref:MFS transporter n=1 Tax=Streptomyces sp. CB01580 TaxID=1703933 RepID=UPI00093CD034|nr:MFS transporter [Streptomyces sp. CB01580]
MPSTHPSPHHVHARPSPVRAAWLTGVGIVLIAFNLRLAISSASALLEQLRAQDGFGPVVASLVPTLPTLCFAAVGATSAMLARRVGTERAVLLALTALCAGLAVRAVPGAAALLTGTLLGAAGLALCNVLLPAVVRDRFPDRVARLTGVYTVAMALGSSVAAAAAVPVADLVGSPSLGLAAWTLPALLALAVWAARPRSPEPAAEARTPTERVSAWSMGRTRQGMLITAYFALQSLSSYAMIGWLPSMLSDQGLGSARAGTMLGLTLAVGIPATFALMPLTRGAGRLRAAFVLVGASLVAGCLGLALAPLAAPALWAVLAGVGLSAFPLVLAVITTGGRSAQETAALSTFAQSTGYLVASAGPLGIGLLRSATGRWDVPLAVLIALAVVQCLVGLALTARTTGRDSTVQGVRDDVHDMRDGKNGPDDQNGHGNQEGHDDRDDRVGSDRG